MKIQFKFNGIKTSITLRDDIVSLWVIGNNNQDAPDITRTIIDFFDTCILNYKGETARGLSMHVHSSMIEDFLDEIDYCLYCSIKEQI